MPPSLSSAARFNFQIKKEGTGAAAAAHLLTLIENGTWDAQLPGEHELAGTLNISRNSLRAALEILRRKKILSTRKGQRTVILPRNRKKNVRSLRKIHLLTSESADEFSSFTQAWSIELRQRLANDGFHLQIHTCHSLFKHRTTRALERFVKANPGELWILCLASPQMQAWFMRNRIPSILAGSPHPDIRLPFVDINMRAIGRHAAGLLLAAGHRSFGVLLADDHYAGDRNVLLGVKEAAGNHPQPLRIREINYSSEPDVLFHRLKHVFSESDPPTGLILCQAGCVCGVAFALNRIGLLVPEEVSLVCLKEEAFMNYLTPPLDHYRFNPRHYVRKLLRLICQCLEKTDISLGCNSWLIPEYIPGRSIGAPRTR